MPPLFELDTSSLHKTTTVVAPQFTTLLEIGEGQPLNEIETSDDCKPNIRSCTILVPILREEFVKNPTAPSEELLRKFIKRIREIESYAMDMGHLKIRSETNTETLSQEQQDKVRDPVSTTLLESFSDNLYFLWRMATNPKLVTATPCIPLIHPEKQAWFIQVSRYISPTPRPQLPNFRQDQPNENHQWATAMNRVTAAWEQQLQQQASKETDKKNKEKWKDWEKLTKVQRDTILLASMGDDLIVSEYPNDIMLEIIGNNGPRVELELHQKLNQNIICLDSGLCSCLAKGLLLSQPSENDINYFSPAFTPSTSHSKKDRSMSAVHFMVQEDIGKVSDNMIADLTKQTVSFPRTYNQLFHQIKNFPDLCTLLFGPNSMLASTKKDLVYHISTYERSYERGLALKWYFGACFLDRVHVRTQIFLRSCAFGDPHQVNGLALNCNQILNSIQLNEFTPSLPPWVNATEDKKSNTSKRTRPDPHSSPSTGGNSYSNRQHLQNWEQGMRLQPHENSNAIFHARNKEGIEPPYTRAGRPMCHRFYGTGVCDNSCILAHTNLDDDERRVWRIFITHYRQNYQRYISSNPYRNRNPNVPNYYRNQDGQQRNQQNRDEQPRNQHDRNDPQHRNRSNRDTRRPAPAGAGRGEGQQGS